MSVQFPRHARLTGTGQPLIHIHAFFKPSDPREIPGLGRVAVTPRFSNDGPPTIECLESVGPQPYKLELFGERGWRTINPNIHHQIDVIDYVAGHVWTVSMLTMVRYGAYTLVVSHANADGIMCHRRIEVRDETFSVVRRDAKVLDDRVDLRRIRE